MSSTFRVVQEGEWPVVPGHRLERVVGAGGFATVYEAVDLQLGRRVAVKVFGAHLSAERMREQFEREASAAAALSDHPNIVTIHQSGITDDGRPYLTMTLMASSLGSVTALPAEQVVSVGIKIASALGSAHEEGIVHGDVKPDNILLNRFGEPALADFGIATISDAGRSNGPQSFSAMYAAPEVIDDRPASEGSDIYSLGSTLYALLAGREPFRRDAGASTAEFLVARSETTHPTIGLGDDYRTFADLITQMTSSDASSRPRSAVEVCDRLSAFEDSMGWSRSRSVVGRSQFDTTGPSRPSRPRRRTALMLAAGVAVAVVIAVAVFAVSRGGEGANGPPAGDGRSSSPASVLSPGTSIPSTAIAPSDGGREIVGFGEMPTATEIDSFQQRLTGLFQAEFDRSVAACILEESLPYMTTDGRSSFLVALNPSWLPTGSDVALAYTAIDECVDPGHAARLSVGLWIPGERTWNDETGVNASCLSSGLQSSFTSAGEILAVVLSHTRGFADAASRLIVECDESGKGGAPPLAPENDVVFLGLSAKYGQLEAECLLDNLPSQREQVLFELITRAEFTSPLAVTAAEDVEAFLYDEYGIELYTEPAEAPLLTEALEACDLR